MKTHTLHSLTLLMAASWLAIQPVAVAAPAPPLVVDGNTAFATDLFQRQRAQDGNLFFSPYSISTALAMTYAGARGQTATEMARALHFDQPAPALHEGFAALAGRMDQIQAGGQVKLSVANSLWAQKDYRFTEEFLGVAKNRYGAEARLMDFAAATDASRREINAWVEQKTQDKIKDFLHDGDVTTLTRLVLCNAIYFMGNWAAKFDVAATKPAPFVLATGGTVPTPTMYQQSQYKTAKVGGVGLIDLPYAGGNVSMVIVLPNAPNGLAEVERSCTSEQLGQWLADLDRARSTKTDLYLPRFKTSSRVSLGKTLGEMGMPLAFSDAADFSGMDGSKNLKIGAVIHQAFVDVNEEGTEAAAATAVGISLMSAPVDPPVFKVDHPFLFLIREKQTGSILFMGRVLDPTN